MTRCIYVDLAALTFNLFIEKFSLCELCGNLDYKKYHIPKNSCVEHGIAFILQITKLQNECSSVFCITTCTQ